MKNLSVVFLILLFFSCQDNKKNEKFETSIIDKKLLHIYEKVIKTEKDTIVVSIDTIKGDISVNKVAMLYSDNDSDLNVFTRIDENNLKFLKYLDSTIKLYSFSILCENYYVFSLEKVGVISLVYNVDFVRNGIYLKETELLNSDDLHKLHLRTDLYFDSINEEHDKLLKQLIADIKEEKNS